MGKGVLKGAINIVTGAIINKNIATGDYQLIIVNIEIFNPYGINRNYYVVALVYAEEKGSSNFEFILKLTD